MLKVKRIKRAFEEKDQPKPTQYRHFWADIGSRLITNTFGLITYILMTYRVYVCVCVCVCVLLFYFVNLLSASSTFFGLLYRDNLFVNRIIT